MKRPERTRCRERGSALPIAILVLVLLSTMGIALLVLSENEMKLNRADHRGKKAYYLAEAGLDHARQQLKRTNGLGPMDDDLVAASGGATGDGTINFAAGALEPVFDANGLLSGFNAGIGDDAALVPVTAFGEGSYTAYLTNDPLDDMAVTTDLNSRVMLTGIGGGPNRTWEIVQAIVEPEPVLFTTPPAALTILGPNPIYSPGSSAAKEYVGDDCDGVGIPGLFVPAVGGVGSAAVAIIEADMGNPDYRAGGLPAIDAIADLTNAGEPAITTAIDPRWYDCGEVKQMIEELRCMADLVCTTSSCTSPPSSPQRIVFVDADFQFTPSTEEGTIVITGELDVSGNFDWNGILLVIGEGKVVRNGGGNQSLSGAVVVAKINGPDNVYGTADDCTEAPDGFGSADWSLSGGGNSDIVFCTNDQVHQPQHAYQIVEFLQR